MRRGTARLTPQQKPVRTQSANTGAGRQGKYKDDGQNDLNAAASYVSLCARTAARELAYAATTVRARACSAQP